MSQSMTLGAHHIGLTVPDIAAAETFFQEVLGFERVGEVPDYPAVFVSDGALMVTLWRAADPAAARGFDRRNNIGLHHLALRVAGQATLDELCQVLADRADAEIEFPPQPLGAAGARHLMCRIPGGVRLELVAA